MDYIRSIVNKHCFSILGITETWLHEDVSDGEIMINGYRLFRKDRQGRMGGGACLYVHHSLQIKVHNEITHPSLEMLWLEINLSKRNYYVGCLYRPPDAHVQFWSILEESLEILEGNDVILMGDLNVNTMDIADPNLQHLNSICTSLQLNNIIQSPTRITATTSKCLDLILTNNDLVSKLGKVEHLDFSDHALVYSAAASTIVRPVILHPRIFYRRHWKSDVNLSMQLNEALNRNMSHLTASGTIDDMWQEWKTKFLAALDDVAPLVETRVSSRKHRCPWMTPELLHLIHKQKSVYRKVTRSNGKNSNAVKEHRLIRSQSTNLYRRLKNEYLQRRICDYKNSPRQLWNVINYITGRKEQRHPPSADLAALAKHFENLLLYPGPICQLPLGPYEKQSFYQFIPVSPSEVERHLLDLLSNKAPGPDAITPSDLKLTAGRIAETVAILFNESLATGELPVDFKAGNIIPILKPGKMDSSLPTNYRGITLTSILSKILEKIVYHQIEEFLEKGKAFDDAQYGFRKNRSCTDLLMTVVDDWLLARDNKLSTAVVFIDLSKAFDNVQHQYLLILLQRLRLGGNVLKWLYNFLRERSQKVIIGDKSSNTFTSSKGVPQGSVLGPLLFNLYVADLAKIADQFQTSLPSFADDLTLYCSRSTLAKACQDVSNALSAVCDALMDRGLHLNNDKTVAMCIGPSRCRNNGSTITQPITCQGKIIGQVSQTRLLGIIVDNRLSWHAQVDSVIAKVSRKIGALRRSYRQLTPAARRLYYTAVIQPDLEYASISYVPSLSTLQRNRLLGSWRKAIRCVAGLHFHDKIDSALTELKITPLEHRWALQLVLAIRRCRNYTAPPALCSKVSRPNHSYQTRGLDSLFHPLRPSSRSGSVSFSNRAPLLWNALPSSIRKSPNACSFKRNFLMLLSADQSFLNAIVDLALGNADV